MITPSELEHRTVSLSDIDSGQETFRITTNNAVKDLVRSFNRVGLINPPVLLRQGTGYTVVCGNRRIAAARTLGWQTIPARIPGLEVDPLGCAMLAISDNSGERPLNLIETSRALFLLLSFIPEKNERNRVAGELGLPANTSFLRKIESLCRLPQSVQNGILSGDIALPSALMLGKLPVETAETLSGLLVRMKLSLNKQRELIVTLQEISARDDLTIHDILQAPEICAITNDPDMEAPRKAGLIRNILRERRFPQLSRARASFDRLRKDMNLGENLSLKPPPGFESTRYTVTFSFSNLSDLEAHRKTLARLAKDERMQALLSTLGNRI